jgi:hypothetical protein
LLPAGFESTIAAREWTQIHASDRAATGIIEGKKKKDSFIDCGIEGVTSRYMSNILQVNYLGYNTQNLNCASNLYIRVKKSI